MRKISMGLLMVPGMAFAAAPFADQFDEHQHWILTAYAYCLAFGLAALLTLFVISLIRKNRTHEFFGKISNSLIRHRIGGIIVAGILLAIPLGIFCEALWDAIWFTSIPVIFIFVVAFLLLLINRKFREKRLLSPSALKWLSMISASAIISSLLFIILTVGGLLPGTDESYIVYSGSYRIDFVFLNHPFGSITEIWQLTPVFFAETVLAVMLYGLGLLIRYLRKKLSSNRRREHE